MACLGVLTLLALSSLPHALSPPSRALGAPLQAGILRPQSAYGWHQLNTTNAPPGTASGGFAFDPVDNYTVLFGGCTSGNFWYSTCTPSNTTWTYGNGTWTQLHPTASPPARYYTSLTWDAADGVLLLFGGNGTSSFLNDTWTFLHGSWTQVHPALSPPARAAASMGYDTAANTVVLFGGESFRTLINIATETYQGADWSDTWLYSAGAWTNITGHIAVTPPARDSASFAYDRQDTGLLLVGGFGWTMGGYNSADSWLFQRGGTNQTYGNWTQLSPAQSPPSRNNGALAYDPQLDTTVLFGGHDSYTFYNDTWGYNHSAPWVTLVPQGTNSSGPGVAPSQRWAAQLAYDGADQCLILFGGYNGPGGYSTSGYTYYNDTWAFGSCPGGGVTNGTGNGTHSGGVAPLAAAVTVVSLTGTTTVTATYLVTVSGGRLPYTIQWNFGDGQWGSGVPNRDISHTFVRAGSFAPLVTITDGANTVRSYQLPTVQVTPAPGSASHGASSLGTLATYAVVGGVLALIAATAASLRMRQRRFRQIAREGEAIVQELAEGESENLG